MILRLFVVPALIVGVLVGLFLIGPTLAGWFNRLLGRPGGGYSAQHFLQKLDDPNKEVRWRAASDLAQVLPRDDALASDPELALQLNNRLREALTDGAKAEKEAAGPLDGKPWQEGQPERKKLEKSRDYILFLISCLGNTRIPAGVEVLSELALQDSGLEGRELARRRRQALWALANLGANLAKYDRMTEEEKDAIENQLEQMGGSQARAVRLYLRDRRAGKQHALGMDQVVENCSQAKDPFLRKLAALVTNYWWGTTAENATIEEALVRLSTDNGQGEDELERARDEGAESTRPVETKPGFQVQAGANIALARRGSPKVRMDLLPVMLDLVKLREIVQLKSKDGSKKPDEGLAVETVMNTLKAVVEYHKRRPEDPLTKAREAINRLTEDANPAIRAAAAEAKIELGNK
jgi:hypothetical protein